MRPDAKRGMRCAEGMKLAGAVSILMSLAVPGVRGAGGEEVPAPVGAIKVGDEVALMADSPGKIKRGNPAVAFGKGTFLVAWQEGWHGDGGSSRICALRVGLDGKALDAKRIEIAPCQTGVQENPRVAFFGGSFLVVWQDMRNGRDCDVLGARVSPEGKVLDAQPIPIAAGARSQAMPDLAADDRGFMVVWHGFRGEETFPRVFAVRVGADGAAGSPAAVIEGSSPRIAWNGKDHLVACFDLKPARPRTSMFVKYLRMDGAGRKLYLSTYRENVSSLCQVSICGVPGKGWVLVYPRAVPDFWGWSGPAAQRAYSIMPDGRKAADFPSQSYYDPKARKSMVPPNWLDTSIGKEVHRAAGPANVPGIWPWGGSALAADGQHCVAVWQRYHTGGATGIDLVNGDIQAGRVDGWKPLDRDGITVADSAAEEIAPALAGNGAGRLLCVYEKVLEGKSSIAARVLGTR